MEQIYQKLNEMLMEQYPDQAMRDEAIATMGEIVINETLIEAIEAITNESKRKQFVEAINTGNQDLAEDIADEAGVDIVDIMERKSKEVFGSV